MKRFFREQGMRPQAAKSDRVYMALHEDKLLAALRLCPFGDNWVLRSMCVESSYRGQGIGRHFLKSLLNVFAETECYCFAYEHLVVFYQSTGFKLIEVEQVPLIVAERFRCYQNSGKNVCLMQYRPG
ncbi:MAG: GNAT family N-acetyltransferase [Gammaproteobacteria bacterium]|nr:GNAT family N-acetyltransferase [Gammaproteobacteria bacterium]